MSAGRERNKWMKEWNKKGPSTKGKGKATMQKLATGGENCRPASTPGRGHDTKPYPLYMRGTMLEIIVFWLKYNIDIENIDFWFEGVAWHTAEGEKAPWGL